MSDDGSMVGNLLLWPGGGCDSVVVLRFGRGDEGGGCGAGAGGGMGLRWCVR
jgi:hypothetical protein